MLETERQKTTRLEVNMKLSEEETESRVRDVKTELEMKKQDIARFVYLRQSRDDILAMVVKFSHFLELPCSC